jgi:hypothetical protein
MEFLQLLRSLVTTDETAFLLDPNGLSVVFCRTNRLGGGQHAFGYQVLDWV